MQDLVASAHRSQVPSLQLQVKGYERYTDWHFLCRAPRARLSRQPWAGPAINMMPVCDPL
jgi:hypothetical protein